MDDYLTAPAMLGAAAAIALLLWLTLRRRAQRSGSAEEQGRVDTIIGWPPEPVRMLRTTERAAYNILTLALPGQMVFAQVPLARFINVPKRLSYAEWMRRLGSHCVDFVVCDAASKVVAVVDVRPPAALISERLQRRLDRVSRTLQSIDVPLHVWVEDALPTVEAAREALAGIAAMPTSSGALPGPVRGVPVPSPRAAAGAESGPAGAGEVEVIEWTDARASTWFDELDPEPPRQPPAPGRTAG